MRKSLGFRASMGICLATVVAGLGCSSENAAAPSPSASAAAVTVPTGPPTKVGEKGLEITPTGKNSTVSGANNYPIFTVKNTGKKAVTSYSLQVFVNDESGDKLGQQYPTVSPFDPIKPGASVEITQGIPQSTGNKTEVVIWKINYADNTFWEDQGAQDKRPIKPASAAPSAASSAATPASASPAAAPPAKGGAKTK